MRRLIMAASIGAVIAPVTLNPADKNAALTLSNGDLSAVRAPGGAWAAVRATLYRSTGKFYFEVTFDAGATNSLEVGVASASFPIGSSLDSTAHSWVIFSDNGQPYYNGIAVGSPIGAIVVTKRAGVAIDLDAGKIWYRVDGVWSGDPSAGTGQRHNSTPGLAVAPALSLYNGSSGATIALKAAHLAGSLPSGYSAWQS